MLGLPKPTAHRIVRMLEGEGLLQREPGSSRYVPGARLERLGLDIVAASMSRAPRHAILEALSQQIGETCNFGVMAGSHVVYLDRVESAWPFGLRFERGSHVPLHCTSMGKLFLSLLPAHKRALMLRSIPLYRYTEHTITDVDRLEEELGRIRSVGSFDRRPGVSGRRGMRRGSGPWSEKTAGRGAGGFRAPCAHVAATGCSAHSAAAGRRRTAWRRRSSRVQMLSEEERS